MAFIPSSARTPTSALASTPDTSFPPADAAPAPTAAPAPATRTGPSDVCPPADGSYNLTLCIDCTPIPSQGEVLPVVRLDDWLSPLVAKVCELKKVGHYSAIQYGEGKALVAQLLQANLPPSGSIVVVDSMLPLSPACIEVLSPVATCVFRGIR